MNHGTISHWNDARGFGFIQPDGGGPELFMHFSSLRGARERCGRPLKIGDRVSYALGENYKGKCAVDVIRNLEIAAINRSAQFTE